MAKRKKGHRQGYDTKHPSKPGDLDIPGHQQGHRRRESEESKRLREE